MANFWRHSKEVKTKEEGKPDVLTSKSEVTALKERIAKAQEEPSPTHDPPNNDLQSQTPTHVEEKQKMERHNHCLGAVGIHGVISAWKRIQQIDHKMQLKSKNDLAVCILFLVYLSFNNTEKIGFGVVIPNTSPDAPVLEIILTILACGGGIVYAAAAQAL
eukprot:15365463-Ditylum_brightwellii.AAC.1